MDKMKRDLNFKSTNTGGENGAAFLESLLLMKLKWQFPQENANYLLIFIVGIG